VIGVLGVLILGSLAAECPARAPQSGGVGQPQIVRVPAAAAMDLNREGKLLYRQERFAEARTKYAAALSADPEFLSPALNLACAYSRETNYSGAAQEAIRLVRRAYVPWAREIREAADLGVLQYQPEGKLVSAALAETGRKWGGELRGSLPFVARVRPPVRVAGEGVLVLNLGQEIFAWQPRTGRYLQVTADDGRVLAFAQSTSSDKIVYVRAGRLIRQAGRPEVLRGLSLRLLELPTMELSPPVDLPGDVRKVELWFPGAGMAALRVTTAAGETQHYRFAGQSLDPASPSVPSSGTPTTVLTTDGVSGSTRKFTGCAFSARDDVGKDELPSVRLSVAKRPDAFLDAKHGAGLYGLPFPKQTAGVDSTDAARLRPPSP
jgi:tetratricopeptide (TPR) repeat protein